MPLLGAPAEAPGFEEYDYGLRGWIARLKGPRESDASFLVRRLAELPYFNQAGIRVRTLLWPDPGRDLTRVVLASNGR